MAGSLLGPDQIRKINATFPTLVAHVRSLLAADHTGVGLMRVHCMVETFDSDEMSRIFRELSFISPKEKLALVRAAIYELTVTDTELFVSPEAPVKPVTEINARLVQSMTVQPKVFTPPQFKLNAAVSDAAEIAKTDTKPEPVVTSTHTSLVATQVKAGAEEQKAQQSKLDAAVAKLRESSAPKVVEPTIGEAAADYYNAKIDEIEVNAISNAQQEALGINPALQTPKE